MKMSGPSGLDRVTIELSVIIGQTTIPIEKLLRMGRGAVIMLDAGPEDDCRIYAGPKLIGSGQPVANAGRIGLLISKIGER